MSYKAFSFRDCHNLIELTQQGEGISSHNKYILVSNDRKQYFS